jgi:lipid II:glycine glycyltransferase (peptidoglycan interpeptide bridge formation enzyme)
MFVAIPYEDQYESEWDRFIEEDAVNGTFLQSRNFLNYHPKDRFVDSSFLLFKDNKLAAVVPGCVIDEDGKKVFSSHAGSTFGGLVIHKKDYTASNIIEMLKALESTLQDKGFHELLLKKTPDLFCKEKTDLLQYILSFCGYNSYSELSTYIDFSDYKNETSDNFSYRQKRNLKYSQRFELSFKELSSDEDVYIFYEILKKNLKKYNTIPIHTAEELLEFKNYRLKNIINFHGVFFENKMISGAMTFNFGHIIHSQYLASDYDYSEYRPMTFLYYNLINISKKNAFKKLSWGISTENRGAILNKSLLTFKEEFGSKYATNRSYYKELQ